MAARAGERVNLTFGSVCSGIEAVSIGWHGLGFAEPAWFSEIDKAASDLLAYRFPDVSNIGDMLEIPFQIEHGIVAAPDILVGGTPCQSFSIAGRREGMNDTRGQLSLTYVEIANAIDRVRADAGQQPCITVWENVPGCLSDKDNAFGCFIAALAGDEVAFEPGERPATGKSSQYWTWDKKRQCHNAKWSVAGLVVGPQRTVAWIVRDAQYFGLAQRRRRVFVVSSARAGFDPGAILFEPDCVRRDSPPSRKQGQDVAGTLDARTEGGGFPGTDGACAGHVVPSPRMAGQQQSGRPDIGVGGVGGWPAEIAATLNAHFGDKQGLEDQHALGGQACSVPHIEGARMRAFGDYVIDGTASTMKERDYKDATDLVIQTSKRCDFDEGDSAETFAIGSFGDYRSSSSSSSLRAAGGDRGGGSETLVCVHGTQDPIHSEHTAHALGRNSGQENVICFTSKDYGADASDDLSPTLRAGGHSDSHANAGVPPAIAYSIQERAISDNPNAGPDGVGVRADDCAYTMEARAVLQAVAYAVSLRGREGGGTAELGDDVAHCLRASEGGGDKAHVLAPIGVRDISPTITSNYGKQVDSSDTSSGPNLVAMASVDMCVTGSVTHALTGEGHDASEDGTGRGNPIVIGYIDSEYNGIRLDQPMRTLLADSPSGGGKPLPAVAFTQNSRDEVRLINEDGSIAGALSAESGSHQTNYLATNMAVRRLMPVECEALQGFPPNWTRIPLSHHAERKISSSRPENRWEPDPAGGWWLMSADGPRYKQIGNSMATPVMRWLGTRIRDYLKLQPYLELIG